MHLSYSGHIYDSQNNIETWSEKLNIYRKLRVFYATHFLNMNVLLRELCVLTLLLFAVQVSCEHLITVHRMSSQIGDTFKINKTKCNSNFCEQRMGSSLSKLNNCHCFCNRSTSQTFSYKTGGCVDDILLKQGKFCLNSYKYKYLMTTPLKGLISVML